MKSLKSRYLDMPPFAKLILLGLIVTLCLLVVSFLSTIIAFAFFGVDTLSYLLGDTLGNDLAYIQFQKYMQIMSHFGLFIIPAIIFAQVFETGIRKFYFPNKHTSFPLLIMGALTVILALPFVEFLGVLNSKMILPQMFQGIESWMKTMEAQAEQMTTLFLSVDTIGGLAINLLMIAIIPAIGEELIFRGIVMKKFEQWFKNTHIAIFVSAFLFSAFHLQFFSFLPRFFLGLMLGYMFVWTGNLIVPMVVHFANNGFAVVTYYLHTKGVIKVDVDSFGNFSDQPLILSILSIIAFIALFYFWKITQIYKRKQFVATE